MSYAYHFYAGAGGERFCYAAAATYRCPVGSEDEPKLLAASAAALLHCDAAKLAKILEKAHHVSIRERDESGKLTETCRACGARLERVGFAAWQEHDRDDAVGERIASRLGFGPPSEQVGARRYFERKRDAMEWAREEAKISTAAARE
jgi:hypothetical protein